MGAEQVECGNPDRPQHGLGGLQAGKDLVAAHAMMIGLPVPILMRDGETRTVGPVNYRHAFHAGNHADVLKHWVLTRVLAHLQRKATPFRAIDTHAGLGFYDLTADEAGRTGEWHDGIGRLDAPFPGAAEALLAPIARRWRPSGRATAPRSIRARRP